MGDPVCYNVANITKEKFIIKANLSKKPAKKSLVSLVGKLNLNWPYSPPLPQRPKFKFYFPAKESKDFLAGFIEK